MNEQKLRSQVGLDIGDLEKISIDLDEVFGFSKTDPNNAVFQAAEFEDAIESAIKNIKSIIADGLKKIKLHGRRIIESITIDLVNHYQFYVENLKDRAGDFIASVESLINSWISLIFNSLIRSLPEEVQIADNTLRIKELSMERSIGIKAGFKSNLLDLFNLVGDSNLKVITTYRIDE